MSERDGRSRPDEPAPRERRPGRRSRVDEASAASFPASDPPSFTPVSGTGPPAQPEEEAGSPPESDRT